MNLKILILSLIGIALLGGYISLNFTGMLVDKNLREQATVSKVIDGDTIEIQTGEKVRLLSINTPEKGQAYYEEAKNRLKELVEGKEVTLEKDVTNKDKYGRLLRYIFINDVFVNLELIREGYANVYTISPNVKYENKLNEAERQCKEIEIRLCKLSNITCIGITYFHWNAEGDDRYNLNDEYVIFVNTCDYSINMTGWTAKDEATHIYEFPHFILSGGATVTLYTGSGRNTETELYWGSSKGKAIWNNTGDTLYLRDSSGNLILEYSYSGF